MSKRSKRIFKILKSKIIKNSDIDSIFFNKRAKMAAAVVIGGKIISIGFNQHKTSPFQKQYSKNKFSIYLHAEIDAIKKAKSKIISFQKSDIYVCRIKNKDGEIVFGNACPCEGCRKAIEKYNFKNVVYT